MNISKCGNCGWLDHYGDDYDDYDDDDDMQYVMCCVSVMNKQLASTLNLSLLLLSLLLGKFSY